MAITADIEIPERKLAMTLKRVEPCMFNPLNPGYSSLLGTWSAECGTPLPIVLCVTCRSKDISSKKSLGRKSNAITFVCNDCGTALQQVGGQYKLTHVTDTGSSVWQKYAGKILYRREWSNIAQGGYSDEELAMMWGSPGVANDTAAMQTNDDKPISPQELQIIKDAHLQFVDMQTRLAGSMGDVKLGDDKFGVLNFIFERVLSEIACSDGPINAREANVLNILLGKEMSKDYYNSQFTRPEFRTIDATDGFTKIINLAIWLGGREQGATYEAKTDHVVGCFEMLGHAILAADGEINQLELDRLSKYTAIAHAKAADYQRINSPTDDITDDIAPPKEAEKNVKAADNVVPTAGKAETPVNDAPDAVQKCIAELHALVGLTSVKGEVETLTNLARSSQSENREVCRFPI